MTAITSVEDALTNLLDLALIENSDWNGQQHTSLSLLPAIRRYIDTVDTRCSVARDLWLWISEAADGHFTRLREVWMGISLSLDMPWHVERYIATRCGLDAQTMAAYERIVRTMSLLCVHDTTADLAL